MTSSAILTTICAHFRVFGIRDNSTAAVRCISSPLCARKSGVCPTIAGLMNPVGVVEDPPLVQAHHRGDALPAADGETPSAPPAPLLRKPVEWHSQTSETAPTEGAPPLPPWGPSLHSCVQRPLPHASMVVLRGAGLRGVGTFVACGDMPLASHAFNHVRVVQFERRPLGADTR